MRTLWLGKNTIRIETEYGPVVLSLQPEEPSVHIHCVPDDGCIAQQGKKRSPIGLLTIMRKRGQNDPS